MSTSTGKTLTIFTSPSGAPDIAPGRYRWDLTNLRDPVGQLTLRSQCINGKDERVVTWMAKDPKVIAAVSAAALHAWIHLADPQGEQNVSFVFHDQKGRWISPAVAELVRRRVDELQLATVTVMNNFGDPR